LKPEALPLPFGAPPAHPAVCIRDRVGARIALAATGSVRVIASPDFLAEE